MKLLVGNIQRYCIHDGPGIRTTVFLKGCQLHCPWCANPENGERRIQTSVQRPKKVYGRWMEDEELIEECLKDEPFYGSNGGVTFSGGEPLLWAQELLPILFELRQRNISTCVETSLFAPTEGIRTALALFDSLFVDVKVLDNERCKEILGGDLALFSRNLLLVESEFSSLPMTFRFPLANGLSFENGNLALLQEFMEKRSTSRFEIFCCHDLASRKYEDLGLPPVHSNRVPEFEYRSFLSRLRSAGIQFTELTL